ncbi:MAG: N-6 DNA methylase [Methylococcales bacterium]
MRVMNNESDFESVAPDTPEKISPSQFMRALRPEYYSDTEDQVAYRFGRANLGISPGIDYSAQRDSIEITTKDSGRVGVVVPHGVLFRGSNEGKIRQQFIEENLLDAVIGLPSNLFYGTGIPAAVLVFKRNKPDSNVLFIDASREYQNGKNQNKLRQSDIDKIVATCQAREGIDKYAYLASFEEIKENDFNLNIPRYVDTFKEEEEINIDVLQAEISQLENELVEVQKEMAGYLKELGYAALS